MKIVTLYSKDDIIKSKLGTLFKISNVHDDMKKAVEYAFDIKFFKYYAQRLEVKNNMKWGGDFSHDLIESPGDKALVLHPDMVPLYDDFTGSFTYAGTLEEVKAANGITSFGVACDKVS